MKNSLFRKYFSIFALGILLSILVLGVVLMVFVSQYFQNERYSLLEHNARQASATTALTYENNLFVFDGNLYIDESNLRITMDQYVTIIYTLLGTSIDAEIFMVDLEGNTLFSSRIQSDKVDPDALIPTEAIDQAIRGKFESTSTLGGYFTGSQYVVGVPVTIYTDQVIGVLFAASSAESLKVFLVEFLKMFVVSAGVVLFVSYVLIYFITSNLVRPLKDMLFATQSFSSGDFTKRVPVSGYDELGQLAMAFNNMASTLAATETTRRSFVANVSHELKTPMTTIGGFVDGILDGTIPEEKRDHYLQIVSNETKRLSRLVRSMLDTARIETGDLELHPKLFDISETLRQTMITFERQIDEKQLEIHGLEVDKVIIWADEDLMHQVVYNLVENAVKFVNEGGEIRVHYHQDPQSTYVAIGNTGEGLEKSEVPMLFERFYKSDRSRSLNKNGVGLGLHIVRSIVNYHKGDISVRSDGSFTEFEFSVPNPPKNVKKDLG